MSKRPSNQPTARLIMHAGTASTGRNRLKIEDMLHWSFHNNCFFINDSRDEPSYGSYSIRQAVIKCYEFGDVRKGNN